MEVSLRFAFPRLALGGGNQSRWDKLLTIILAMSVVVATASLVYVILTARMGVKFTEFYIMGPGGKAEDYPKELVLGEEAAVVVGIVNQERQPTQYRLEVLLGGEQVRLIGPIALEHGNRWEQKVTFTPVQAGLGQEVEFRLYRQGGSEPYHNLHLWVDILRAPE